MKKLWIILLALACCMGSALAEGIPQAVLDARASVVYIEVYREQGRDLPLGNRASRQPTS